jgi:hypothetical protein
MATDLHLQLSALPPLWTTEAKDTEDLVLPLRFACRWHRLTWYPVEKTGDVLFGLTLVTTPAWRHFHLRELAVNHGSHPVRMDASHVAQRAPLVPEVALYRLDDLAPFVPSSPRVE